MSQIFTKEQFELKKEQATKIWLQPYNGWNEKNFEDN